MEGIDIQAIVRQAVLEYVAARERDSLRHVYVMVRLRGDPSEVATALRAMADEIEPQ